MKTSILLAVAVLAASAETVCDKKWSTPETHQVHAVCVDFQSLAQWMPVPPGTKPQTQIFMTVKWGDAVRVKLRGEVKFSDVNKMPDGSLSAAVSFDGIDHEELPEITILKAAKK